MSRELRKRARQLLAEASRPEVVDGQATGAQILSEASWSTAITLAESYLSDLRFHTRSAWTPAHGSVLWWILYPEHGPQAELIGPGTSIPDEYKWWTPITTPSEGRTDEFPILE